MQFRKLQSYLWPGFVILSPSLMCIGKPNLTVHLTEGLETTWVSRLFAQFDLEAFG